MLQAKIIKRPYRDGRGFSVTTKNTDISQRDALEEIIINLAPLVGASEIHKTQGSRGGFYYEIQTNGFLGFQSATNTILDLSRKILTKRQDS